MNTNISRVLPIVIAAIVFGGAGFFGGTQYQKSQTPVNGGRNFANGNLPGGAGQTANGARRMGQNGQGFIAGDIISKDNQSITVKLRDGSSRIVFYSGSTQIAKQTGGSADDLAVGSAVTIAGSTNADGSIVAQSISLRPENSGANPADGSMPSGSNPTSGKMPVVDGRPAVPAE